MKKFNAILLLSGGIDSFIAWHYLNKPQTLYFDTKGMYSKKEIQVIKELVPTTIIDDSLRLGDIEQEDAHLPFRNLFFAMMASAKYADVVYIVGIKDDKVSDKTEKIFETWSIMLSEMENRKIQILSPFWDKTKSDIIKWYLNNGLSEQVLLNTISCYSKGDEIYCGKCASCFRKWVALRANGFDIEFWNNEMILEYKNRCEEGFYNKERNEETLQVIKNYKKGELYDTK